MRMVISQLTRMDAPRICIAGIRPDTGEHVRPTTGRSNPLTRELLVEEGGPLTLGALVELGEVRANPDPPETEDHLFWPNRIETLGRLSPDRYLQLLRENSKPSLRAIFGKDLHRQDWTYAIDRGNGSASLGILRARRKPSIEIDRYGKLRLRLSSAEKPAYLPVTDLRLVEADHKAIKADAVAELNARMGRGVEALLLLGLSRAFLKEGDECERHWLQVNGICMADRPPAAQP